MPIIGGWYGNLSYIGDGGPYLIIEPTQQFSDSVSWIKGKHTFKFGANIIHRDVNWDQGNNAKGYFWIDDGNFGAYPAKTSGHGTFTGYESSELVGGLLGRLYGRWILRVLRDTELGERLLWPGRLARQPQADPKPWPAIRPLHLAERSQQPPCPTSIPRRGS